MAKVVKIALLGCGTVGQGVLEILADENSPLRQRLGVDVEVSKILVRDFKKKRPSFVQKQSLCTDPREIIDDPEIQIVVELMGGIEPASGLVMQALENGKHVVTANKALLAELGPTIFQKALEKKRQLGFEASVAGGIPIVRAISEGFVANRIERIYGIINGTCNYILSEMTELCKGDRPVAPTFDEVLKQAQEAGYAEADPAFDVDGIDAAHKLALLVHLSYGVEIPFKDIYVEGIRHVTSLDIQFAKKLGYRLKLLAISRECAEGIEARVHPTMLPEKHMLAQVPGAMNAIYLVGDRVGEAMLYGAGAGGLPTASAVLSDIAAIAQRSNDDEIVDRSAPIRQATLRPMSAWTGEYYLRFSAVDRPGVLAQITQSLGAHNISIAAVYQPERDKDAAVPIVIMTHEAKEADIQAAFQEIDVLEHILDKPVLIRVEKGKS
jgi:homoserine dehydrogenase